ncbi:MAG: aspartate carbamoyltransferase, partial [Polyangiaceae bacterium]|nr:aspartate carbamoyltransferase [Polyangiaceae bacterium]
MSDRRHLLGIAQLAREDIVSILDAAERWYTMPREEVKNARVLHGRTVVNLFFESSTRTRTS